MPNVDPRTGDVTPRNMIWVEDMPPDFKDSDRKLLTYSHFTHAIVCFFHLDSGPKLVYNGPNDPRGSRFDDWWPYLDGLRQGQYPKTLVMGVGGWNSGTWKAVEGNEAAGAEQIVGFAREKGFAGIDFNFEGDREDLLYSPPAARQRGLTNFANLVVAVRNIWPGILTITPMRFEVATQADYVRRAFGSADWTDALSWVNVQFYTYDRVKPQPQSNVAADYENVLSGINLPAGKVTAGFPLSEQDLQFNRNELLYATGAVRDMFSRHSDFAGMFAWRFRGVFAGDYSEQRLLWAATFAQILHTS